MKFKRSDLSEKMWYRLLKAVFFLVWGILFLSVLLGVINGAFQITVILLLFFGGILEIIRQAFFYVCTGRIAGLK